MPEQAPLHRYQKVVADPAALNRLLMDIFVESHRQSPSELWLDLDATDDTLHGLQEGRFSFMVIIILIAICRCISSVGSTCYALGSVQPIRMRKPVACRSWIG